MSSHAPKLVPITREVLREFYSKNPLTPVDEQLCSEHVQNVVDCINVVKKDGSQVPETVGMDCPTRIDDCFWRSRMFSEEAAFSLGLVASTLDEPYKSQVADMQAQLMKAERAVYDVQQSNTQAAGAQIKKYLPQDFRGRLMAYKQTVTEARYNKQVDDLVAAGGTIRDRYELYLSQQWERREALVAMGNLSGVFKVLVKYVGGVPTVLLDFAKEVNAKVGPMEEQRVTYGPDLYLATNLGIKLAVLAACWAENKEDAAPRCAEVMAVMQPAVEFYCRELVRVVQFLGDIFSRSPFLVTSDQVQAAAAGAGSAVVGGAQQRASRTSMEVGAGVDAVTATVNKGLADHHQKPSTAELGNACGSTLQMAVDLFSGSKTHANADTHSLPTANGSTTSGGLAPNSGGGWIVVVGGAGAPGTKVAGSGLWSGGSGAHQGHDPVIGRASTAVSVMTEYFSCVGDERSSSQELSDVTGGKQTLTLSSLPDSSLPSPNTANPPHGPPPALPASATSAAGAPGAVIAAKGDTGVNAGALHADKKERKSGGCFSCFGG